MLLVHFLYRKIEDTHHGNIHTERQESGSEPQVAFD